MLDTAGLDSAKLLDLTRLSGQVDSVPRSVSARGRAPLLIGAQAPPHPPSLSPPPPPVSLPRTSAAAQAAAAGARRRHVCVRDAGGGGCGASHFRTARVSSTGRRLHARLHFTLARPRWCWGPGCPPRSDAGGEVLLPWGSLEKVGELRARGDAEHASADVEQRCVLSRGMTRDKSTRGGLRVLLHLRSAQRMGADRVFYAPTLKLWWRVE